MVPQNSDAHPRQDVCATSKRLYVIILVFYQKLAARNIRSARRTPLHSKRTLITILGIICLMTVGLIANGSTAPRRAMSDDQKLPWPPIATFSILGYDPDTGEVGGAVQSRVFSVGNGVLWAEADVGVVATQAVVDVSY